jgi:3-oxoacyl-[acyl-carrier protein] reductase
VSESILVTGSSRGIGKAIALRLAQDGYSIVVHCRSQVAAAQEVVAQIHSQGGIARLLQFDVTDRAACESLLLKDIEQHGTYYGVVCNAGLIHDVAFPAMSAAAWDTVLRGNLDAFYNVLQPLIMPMVRRRAAGRIVTLSSVSGLVGNRGQVNYSAAKAGIIGASKALAVELAKRHITVNCVAPGLIGTELVDSHVPIEKLLEAVPMQRMGTAEEVAAVVAFLVSPSASYVTRQVIAVNGGLC